MVLHCIAFKGLSTRNVTVQRAHQSHRQSVTFVSVVTDTLMGKMGCTSILSVKVSAKNTSKVPSAHENGKVGTTRKRRLNEVEPYCNGYT